jgi:hypothetical protein
MARQTRAQLNTANASLFVTGGEVTAPEEKTFNENLNDSLQFLDPSSTKAALEIVRAASGLTVDQWYKITDGTASNDKVIAIKASAVNAFYTNAFNLTDGTFGTYAGGVFLANITLQEYRAGTTPHSGAPTVTDDSDSFYVAGSSRWIDTATQVEYLCTDATVGAAVWQAQSGEYTPTLTASGDLTLTGLEKAYFSRQGILVYVNIQAILDYTAVLNSGSLEITLPITTAATLDSTNSFGNINWKNTSTTPPSTINIEGTSSTVTLYMTSPGSITFGRTYLSFVYPLS